MNHRLCPVPWDPPLFLAQLYRSTHPTPCSLSRTLNTADAAVQMSGLSCASRSTLVITYEYNMR